MKHLLTLVTVVIPSLLFIYLLVTVNYQDTTKRILSDQWLKRSYIINAYVITVAVLLAVGLDIFPFIDTTEAKAVRNYNLLNSVVIMAIYCLRKFKNVYPLQNT